MPTIVMAAHGVERNNGEIGGPQIEAGRSNCPTSSQILFWDCQDAFSCGDHRVRASQGMGQNLMHTPDPSGGGYDRPALAANQL